jgi:TRAP-type uncharacterized transport system fused permease subunit
MQAAQLRKLRHRLRRYASRIRRRDDGGAGRGFRRRRIPRDAGMNTAEYAVGTLAAVAFAGVLLKVLTSDGVRNALASIIERALR